MFLEFGLSLYFPRPGRMAHVVKVFADTGEVYIFCDRFLGKSSGQIVTPQEADATLAQGATCCIACITALEATMERLAVLKGKRPPTNADTEEEQSGEREQPQ